MYAYYCVICVSSLKCEVMDVWLCKVAESHCALVINTNHTSAKCKNPRSLNCKSGSFTDFGHLKSFLSMNTIR